MSFPPDLVRAALHIEDVAFPLPSAFCLAPTALCGLKPSRLSPTRDWARSAQGSTSALVGHSHFRVSSVPFGICSPRFLQHTSQALC